MNEFEPQPRPKCPECEMRMIRVQSGHKLECLRCGHVEQRKAEK